jgi:DNA-binding MarR family transcriptional regulator
VKPSYFAPRCPDDLNETFAADALAREAAACIAARNRDRRLRDFPEERMGGKPNNSPPGGPSSRAKAQARETDRAIMAALATRPMIVSELAAATGMPSTTVSGAMQRNKLAGRCTWISERTAVRNHAYRYSITAKGRAFIAEAPTGPAQCEVAVSAPRTAPDAERPPAAKSAGQRLIAAAEEAVAYARTGDPKGARVSLRPWTGRSAAE